jgi:hypothetical protein
MSSSLRDGEAVLAILFPYVTTCVQLPLGPGGIRPQTKILPTSACADNPFRETVVSRYTVRELMEVVTEKPVRLTLAVWARFW